MTLSILWLRRDLRLHDHAALHAALQAPHPVQPIFVYDTEILEQFTHEEDARLSFITDALCQIDTTLRERGGGLLVLHGKAEEVIPKLYHTLEASGLYAAEDYEPKTMKRDTQVAEAIGRDTCHFVKDHVVFAPEEVLKDDGTPFKVFTPYSKAWNAKANLSDFAEYVVEDTGRYATIETIRDQAQQAGIKVLVPGAGHKAMLKEVGYTYISLKHWRVENAQDRLQHFTHYQVRHYKNKRDMVAEDGTSMLSPYVRFGMVSIRECMRAVAENQGAAKWVSELIWREFYMMILYHAPDSATMEWNETYRGMVWSDNAVHLQAWKEGKTGYPIVDAAMRQLLEIGWMHNRARMIVASFLTKDLHIDWRLGEEHFAQYLMDYELSSNVGGWQWAASTGTDAQPYFRIFNPVLQSKKCDPSGDYIRRYVPELRQVEGDSIHAPLTLDGSRPKEYPEEIVNHFEERDKTLAIFKKLKG